MDIIKYCSPIALPIKVKEAILNFKAQKIEGIKKEYAKLYPQFIETEIKNVLGDVIGTEKTPIIYIEKDGDKVVTEKVTIKEADKEITYNVLDSQGNISADVQSLIDEGKIKVKPTLESYVEEQIEELKIREVTDSDYNLELQEIPADATQEEKAEIEKTNQFKTELKESILEKIQGVADLSYNKAKMYLANKKNLTLDQVERYKAKYKVALKAKAGDSQANKMLELEATLTGVAVDSLVNVIVDLGTKWDEELKSFGVRIDAVRVKVQKMVDTETEKSIELIAKGSQLKADVTDEEILAMFE